MLPSGRADVTVGDMRLSTGLFINAAGLHAVPLAKAVKGLKDEARRCLPTAYYAKGNYFRLQGRVPPTAAW